MKSQVLLTVWCHISCEAAGEFWHWSLSGVKGLSRVNFTSSCLSFVQYFVQYGYFNSPVKLSRLENTKRTRTIISRDCVVCRNKLYLQSNSQIQVKKDTDQARGNLRKRLAFLCHPTQLHQPRMADWRLAKNKAEILDLTVCERNKKEPRSYEMFVGTQKGLDVPVWIDSRATPTHLYIARSQLIYSIPCSY